MHTTPAPALAAPPIADGDVSDSYEKEFDGVQDVFELQVRRPARIRDPLLPLSPTEADPKLPSDNSAT